MPYDIDEHRYRFAVWAAGRAYARGKDSSGCTVEMAKSLIDASGLGEIRTLRDLPVEPSEIDQWVFSWITRVRWAARGRHVPNSSGKKAVSTKLIFSYGRAQKLVNVYLKSMIVCAGNESDARVKFLHPPIDRELLAALKKVKPLHEAQKYLQLFTDADRLEHSWTKFRKCDYVAYLNAIKQFQGSEPLWAVEEHWEPGRER